MSRFPRAALVALVAVVALLAVPASTAGAVVSRDPSATGAAAPIVTSAVTTAAAATAAPPLAVVGNQLVDSSTEQPITLHGVDRSGTEYACVQGWGIFDGPSTAASVAAMVKWDVHVVRVPLNEDCWLGSSDVPSQYGGANYRAAIRRYVALLNSYGMVVILDLHLTDGAYTGPDSQCSAATATCQKPMPDYPGAVQFWRSAATVFAADKSVIFDVFNEPFPDRAIGSTGVADQDWKCWEYGGNWCSPGIGYRVAGMQTLVNAIRAAGASNPIMLGGLGYSSDLSKWLQYEPSDPDSALVASWHSYNFSGCATASCWNSTVAKVALKVPVLAGEIGENDCADGYINPLMRWLDNHGVGYLGWTWDTWDCSSGPALISNYNGTPTAFGAGYRTHLRSLGG